jgi:hypothetical protein
MTVVMKLLIDMVTLQTDTEELLVTDTVVKGVKAVVKEIGTGLIGMVPTGTLLTETPITTTAMTRKTTPKTTRPKNAMGLIDIRLIDTPLIGIMTEKVETEAAEKMIHRAVVVEKT